MKKLLATLTSIFILSLFTGVCLAEHRHNNNIAEGRDVWFKSTFGGERFFSLILPNPPFSLQIGFDQMLTWPRDSRFDEYGVINDPDCTAGDGSTAHFDRCKDPESTGVIGVRKFPNPSGVLHLSGLPARLVMQGLIHYIRLQIQMIPKK